MYDWCDLCTLYGLYESCEEFTAPLLYRASIWAGFKTLCRNLSHPFCGTAVQQDVALTFVHSTSQFAAFRYSSTHPRRVRMVLRCYQSCLPTAVHGGNQK
jgi:hypothetical protein